MNQLQDKDSTAVHRRAIRHHISKCRAVKTAPHQQLAAEATTVYKTLVAKSRAHEDAEDDLASAEADVESSEVGFEDAIRDFDADLTKLDRSDPSLGARAAVFPEGFGAVIEPDDEEQLKVLPALHVRIAPYKGRPELAASLAALTSAESTFGDMVEANKTAAGAAKAAFEEEKEARKAVREQLASSYGRLRDFYKAKPKQAERFFLRVGSRRSSAGDESATTAGSTKAGTTTAGSSGATASSSASAGTPTTSNGTP